MGQHDLIQSEAMRGFTGLPRYGSINDLCEKTGVYSLTARRNKKMICILYRIKSNMTPNYLSNLHPRYVGDISSYTLGNITGFTNVSNRLEFSKLSVSPSTIRLSKIQNRLASFQISDALILFIARYVETAVL